MGAGHEIEQRPLAETYAWIKEQYGKRKAGIRVGIG